MISLKESILSSTNTGKNAKLTKEYLFNLGWTEGDTFKSSIYSPDLKHHIRKLDSDDVFYALVFNYGKRIQYKCRIKTIMDLEKLLQFWENASNMNIHSKNYIEELKKLIDYLGKDGYIKSKIK